MTSRMAVAPRVVSLAARVNLSSSGEIGRVFWR